MKIIDVIVEKAKQLYSKSFGLPEKQNKIIKRQDSLIEKRDILEVEKAVDNDGMIRVKRERFGFLEKAVKYIFEYNSHREYEIIEEDEVVDRFTKVERMLAHMFVYYYDIDMLRMHSGGNYEELGRLYKEAKSILEK